MTPEEIATNEVERVIQNCDEYTKGCYESALRAYKSLCSDGHSGGSFNITAYILKRLLDGEPLSPITEDDFYEPYHVDKDGTKYCQSYRKLGLFKYIYPDGTIKYSDLDRYFAYEVDKPYSSYSNGVIRNILDEMFPITMPYTADKNYEVIVQTVEQNDTTYLKIISIQEVGGDKFEVNRYFKIDDNDCVEITKEEFESKINKI